MLRIDGNYRRRAIVGLLICACCLCPQPAHAVEELDPSTTTDSTAVEVYESDVDNATDDQMTEAESDSDGKIDESLPTTSDASSVLIAEERPLSEDDQAGEVPSYSDEEPDQGELSTTPPQDDADDTLPVDAEGELPLDDAPQPDVVADPSPASSDDLSLVSFTNEEPKRLSDGLYWIESGVSDTQFLDVSGGSKKSGANVQSYQTNKTLAQAWTISYDLASGCYRILNAGSSLALDVSGAVAKSGRNVQVWTPNGAVTQQWILVGDEISGWEVVSALSGDLVLDIAGASKRNGANVQIYKRNGTRAQRFWFVPTSGAEPGERLVDDGVYEITVGGYALDVKGGSTASGANVQAFQQNGTDAQRWAISWADGYYQISNVKSGHMLDVSGARLSPGSNVQVYKDNGTDAQLWRIQDNGDGTFLLVNKATSLALDLWGNRRSNGTNVDAYRKNGTSAQSWSITRAVYNAPVPTGYVELALASDSSVVMSLPVFPPASDAAEEDECPPLLTYSIGDPNQKWNLTKLSGDTVKLQNIGSGRWLRDNWDASEENEPLSWKLVRGDSGLYLQSDGRYLGSKQAVMGSALELVAPTSPDALLFIVRSTPLLENGFYTFTSSDGNALDVSGGSTGSGANVQTYKANGTAAQTFYVVKADDGSYTIYNDKSNKALDVQSASREDGANVQQYTPNGTSAQRWKVSWKDGCYHFTNLASGLLLSVDAASGSSNVISSKKGSSGWQLQATTSFKAEAGLTPQEKVVAWAEAQVGTKAYSGKRNVYSLKSDQLEVVYNYPKNGYDWCDIFADSAYIHCFGLNLAMKMINQPEDGLGAGCYYSANYYRSVGAFSRTPSLGAQVFFGSAGDEEHTGIVVGIDSKNLYTIEGNTGYSEGYSGGAVLRRTYKLNNSRIVGFGLPNWAIAA